MAETVLVTGVSGFIAKHVALALLKAGYSVRGTVRSQDREEEVRSALAAHGGAIEQLSFVHTDLTSDEGWDEAMAGCDFVQHIASPFPMAQPKDRNALVPAARQGTLRVLDAAKEEGVIRVVVTSSVVAMMYRPDRPADVKVRETDWTDVDWKPLNPYSVSKARAERAAWDWAEKNDWKDRLCVVNPGLVLGPALDATTGTSLDVLKLLLEGTYPINPPANYLIVDVRDLAELHVAAMRIPGAAGRRLIGAGETLGTTEIAKILAAEFPEYAKKIPTRTAPAAMIRFLALFDANVRAVVPNLGVRPVAESGYVTELTGVTFRPGREAVIDAARSLMEYGAVAPPTRQPGPPRG
jgi:dihydroflavonol-4-reductase